MSSLEFIERRRPGRIEVDPILIPLLRASAASRTQPGPSGRTDSSFCRGLVLATLLATPFWAGLLVVAFYLVD